MSGIHKEIFQNCIPELHQTSQVALTAQKTPSRTHMNMISLFRVWFILLTFDGHEVLLCMILQS